METESFLKFLNRTTLESRKVQLGLRIYPTLRKEMSRDASRLGMTETDYIIRLIFARLHCIRDGSEETFLTKKSLQEMFGG